MKVVLVDDEKSMLLIMNKMISKIPDIEIVGSFQNPNDAFLYIMENRVDMAFVDINMPEENGLDFTRRVTAEIENIAVSFITAHKEYALEAFGVHAFDYIVKPISQEKLQNSIQIAKERLAFLQPAQKQKKSPKLFVNCLGSMEIRGADNSMVQFTSTKSIELLAYLLLKRGKFVSKWCITEDVFGGMPPHNAETYLNTTIYKLRKALEPYGMRTAIISSDESYKIDIKEIEVDFIEFENHVTSLIQINNHNREEGIKTERIYCGELFGEKDYYWSLHEKEKLTEIYFSFAKKMIKYLLDNNILTGALQIAKKLVYINELDEAANCLLMRIYAAQRNRLLLERQYERYSKALKQDLDIIPENTVRNLYITLTKTLI